MRALSPGTLREEKPTALAAALPKIVPARHVHFKTIKAHEHIAAALKQKMAETNGMCYEANCLFRVNVDIGN